MMRFGRASLLVITVLAAPPISARGATLSHEQRIVALQKAQEAFDRGVQLARRQPSDASAAFREAASHYESIIASGVQNGRLYYNLANTQLQLNDLGHAIANYRRAEKLIPADGRLKANLDYARSLRRNQFETPALGAVSRALLFWHYNVALRWRSRALITVYVAFWTALIVRVFFRRWRWRYALGVLTFCGLVLSASVAASLYYENREPAGVIVSDNVTVRKGNGEGYEPRFEQPLHTGVEFNVLERRADWLHIRLPDHRDGWIRATDTEII